MSRIRTYIRFLHVTFTFLPIAITYIRDRRRYLLFGSDRTVSTQMQKERAERIKNAMLKLGPTFIKLGQVLSTRPDILPSSYTDSLSSLQDDVPPSDWSKIRRQIENELNGDIDDLYDNFNREALSGASLAQVHTAEVNGEKVAVKVRRPKVKHQVKRDIQVMKWLKPIIMRFVGNSRSFSVKTIVDEFSKTLEQEMDYEREKRELETIKQNFSDNPKIRIPSVLGTHCSGKILTMEYVDGVKIDNIEEIDKMGLDRTELSEEIQRAYFQMVVNDGIFHADPHPGNIAVQEDGSIVFYDFGMTGQIDEETRRQIVDLYIAIATDQFEDALDVLVDMGILDPDVNRDLMLEAFELAVKEVRGEDVDQRRAQDLLKSIEVELYEFPFRLPPNYSMLIRTATIANGVCLKLDPTIDFVEVVSKLLKEEGYVQSTAVRMTKEKADEFMGNIQQILQSPGEFNKAVEKINSGELEAQVDLKQSEDLVRTGERVIASVLMSGMVISAAILYAVNPMIATLPLFFFVLFGIQLIRI